ncbi:hypothetical protein O6H91_Y305400 [Diphasiastrum complanatum]|nr:hypothetical protein O6H91_Y305400 [Diphasiastrum complanatum]
MGTLGRVVYRVGFWVRETGQALDRLGCRLQGNYAFQEQLSRHRTIMNLFDKLPTVAENVFVAPSAAVIGDVKIGARSSIWYGCVLRGMCLSLIVLNLVLVSNQNSNKPLWSHYNMTELKNLCSHLKILFFRLLLVERTKRAFDSQ